MNSLLPTILTDLLPLVLALLAARFGFKPPERYSPVAWLNSAALKGRGPTIAAAVTLLVCCAASLVRPPVPTIHDEFSYLLAADTFAAGRMTNPSPPDPEFFASPHILTAPTYQSKYPPLQGVFLALGQKLFDAPIVGVWLGCALAAGALVWALEASYSAGWALFGGLLPAFRFGIFKWDADLSWSYWQTSLWGGGLAMFGGALAFGAVWRMLDRPDRRNSFLFGAGAAVLALQRPYDGFVLILTLLVVLCLALVRSRGFIGALSALLPSAAPVLLALAGSAVYSHAVALDPLDLPHVVYSRQHQQVGHFRFSPPSVPEVPPEGRLGEFHSRFGQERSAASGDGWIGYPDAAVRLHLGFFLGPVLLFALPLLIPLWRRRRVWLPSLVTAAGLLAYAVTSVGQIHAHYLAPFAPAMIFLIIGSLQRASEGPGVGPAFGGAYVNGVAAACALTFLLSFGLRAAAYPARPDEFPEARTILEDRLLAEPGKDLVIVRYPPGFTGGQEWVYNGADLNQAEIVWAHDLSDEKNRRLVARYADRNAWLLLIEGLAERRLVPYPK